MIEMTLNTINEIVMLSNQKAEKLSWMRQKLTRQHIVMCVTHDNCGSLLEDSGKFVAMLESNIHYWP